MILPTKRITEERSLLGIGGRLLLLLDEPRTVSRLWDDFKKHEPSADAASQITFDWFVLALDVLFMLGAVRLEKGLLRRQGS